MSRWYVLTIPLRVLRELSLCWVSNIVAWYQRLSVLLPFDNHNFFQPLSCMSRSSSRWEFYFHSYMLTIYVCLYWILELVIFYSLIRRGYIRKVSVQLAQKYFSCVCVTGSFSCSERNNWKKTRLKQGSKKREWKSKRCCRHQPTWLIIALLSHQYRSTVAPISLRCRSVVALLSHRYRTDIAPLLIRCCLSCCHYAVAPLLHHCHAVVEPLSLRPIEGINNSILKCCCSTVTPLLLLMFTGRFTRLSP